MQALLGAGWFRAVVSAALLGAVLWRVDVAAVAGALARAEPWFLVLGLLLGLVQVVLAAYRWHMLLEGGGPAVPFAAVLRIQFVSGFFGLFLPGGVGTEVIRLYSLSRLTGRLAQSVTSILVERLFAMATLFLLVQVGLLLSPPGMPDGVARIGWLGLAGIGALVVLLMLPAARAAAFGLLRAVGLGRAQAKLAALHAGLDAHRRRPGLMAWALAVAVVYQLLRMAPGATALWALGVDVSFVHCLVMLPIITLLTLLPLSVAGVGVREASFVTLFGLVGVAPEAALAASLIAFLQIVASLLPGLWLYAANRLSATRRMASGT